MSAADLLPDLSGEGFQLQLSGSPPKLNPDQDAVFAIYAGPSAAVSSIRIELSLLPTADAAAAQFGPIAEALRNPPPDIFGPNAAQADGTPVFEADATRSYVTARPDAQGNLVYSDAYRMGRVVAIVYTLGNDREATSRMRELVAHALAAKAPGE